MQQHIHIAHHEGRFPVDIPKKDDATAPYMEDAGVFNSVCEGRLDAMSSVIQLSMFAKANDLVLYTDASVDSSKRVAGAAFVRETGLRSWHGHAYTIRGTTNSTAAEVFAAIEALQFALYEIDNFEKDDRVTLHPVKISKVIVLTDCMACLQGPAANDINNRWAKPFRSLFERYIPNLELFSGGREKREITPLVYAFQHLIGTILSRGVDVEIRWIPGHAGIHGNEHADRVAAFAVAEANSRGKPAEKSPSNGVDAAYIALSNRCQALEAENERLRAKLREAGIPE
jgi:ribonuclease HI